MKHLKYFLIILLLGGCAEAELASHVVKQLPTNREERVARATGRFKVGSPYKIRGRVYRPQETYTYSQTGIASWYGPKFHGKMTANGEIFDKYELTAAHKTLQMPSLVRVTNLSNGRSIVVRVNDRGPYAHGRLIDLSERSAELLGFKSKGTAKVRLDLLPQESRMVADIAKSGRSTRGYEIAVNENRSRAFDRLNEQPSKRERVRVQKGYPHTIQGDTETGNFVPDPVIAKVPVQESPEIFIQAGSFANPNNADNLAQELRRFNTTAVQEIPVGNRIFHRVRVGPLDSVDQADALLETLNRNGFTTAKVVID
jgi:rare lipoprotein A